MHIKNKDFRRKQDLFHPLTSATGVHKATALRTGVFCTFCSRTSHHIRSPSGLYNWELGRKPHPKENTGLPPQQHTQHSNGGGILKSGTEGRNPTPLAQRYVSESPWRQAGVCRTLWPEKRPVTSCHHENHFSVFLKKSLLCVIKMKKLRRDFLKAQKTEANNPNVFCVRIP